MIIFICKKKNDLCYVFVDMIMVREIKEFILSCVLLRFVDLNRITIIEVSTWMYFCFLNINRGRRLERWTLIPGWFALREKSLGPVMPPLPRDCLIRQRSPLASEWSHSGMSLSVGKWVYKGVLGKLPADITVFSILLSNKMAITMAVPMGWKKIFQHLVPLIQLLFFHWFSYI